MSPCRCARVEQELRESRRSAAEESCNLGERGDMLFDDLSRSKLQAVAGSSAMANKSNPALSRSRCADLAMLGHTLPPSAGIDRLLGLDFLRGQQLGIDFREGVITLQ